MFFPFNFLALSQARHQHTGFGRPSAEPVPQNIFSITVISSHAIYQSINPTILADISLFFCVFLPFPLIKQYNIRRKLCQAFDIIFHAFYSYFTNNTPNYVSLFNKKAELRLTKIRKTSVLPFLIFLF